MQKNQVTILWRMGKEIGMKPRVYNIKDSTKFNAQNERGHPT